MSRFPRLFYGIAVVVILILGVVLRIWDFGNHPEGLNQDEASIAVEAQSLYHFGVDRNGESFPVHFIAWGSGQNVLYAYALLPLVPLGLTPAVIRLPMLLSGILTLLLIFGIARKLFSPSIALISLLLIALNPWHIMLSRWALESNLLPFCFALAFYCLLLSRRHSLWFIAFAAVLGICLYAYGTAYLIAPLFLAGLLFWNAYWPRVSWRVFMAGCLVFAIFAIPIFLFLIVNSFYLNTMHLGPVSIPDMPSDPRYEILTGVLHGSGWTGYAKDLIQMIKLLTFESDGLIWNSLPFYGCLFPGAIFFALIGLTVIFSQRKNLDRFMIAAFFVWLALGFILGVVQPPNINRVNLILLPLLLCVAVAVDWLIQRERLLILTLGLLWFLFSIFFVKEYFGQDYRKQVGENFFAGILPAIQTARSYAGVPICVTDTINNPYIYVELEEAGDPRVYLQTIHYQHERDEVRVVERLGRYSFGLSQCPTAGSVVYILRQDEVLPAGNAGFLQQQYGDYILYIPENLAEPSNNG